MNNRPEIGNKRSLELYLNEIKNYEPLEPKEEISLARDAKKGDLKSINKLITHNLRFVVAVAKNFQGQGLPFEDLINEGNLGLMKAVGKYDESRGFRFISYAVWWITQGIRQAIQKTGRVIRLPAHVRDSMGKLYRKSIELEQHIEREPTEDELSEITKTSPGWINDLKRIGAEPVSLEDSLGDSDTALLHLLASNDPRPEAAIMKRSLEKEILSVLDTLEEREKLILIYYFGFDGNEHKNLQEIGDELKISSERVRQIKDRALQRLRHVTRSQLLKIYIH
ncbi:MAG: RNA polymerase sigma factor RpoD/SigA [Candidatus Neomarinimicrobiota bacterium]|nr:RNA polymerase sigma factor RpoD/SigA [Candidatus Neomarinimicrobiota bacterium]MEC9026465.1 RNA polymerase sigma factor RpoD/SigA [Candidatus Neomarinimicrobiota bacterium]MEC9106461.1 RNA polymerase sigma factor RpoD/SigA [Candidatus Neomarinimicrobiota bacterium]MED5256539.1 RNA polymerase sigma factor RpoD/SigA [Candidatus Neomarinimicrobiota bacterium]